MGSAAALVSPPGPLHHDVVLTVILHYDPRTIPVEGHTVTGRRSSLEDRLAIHLPTFELFCPEPRVTPIDTELANAAEDRALRMRRLFG